MLQALNEPVGGSIVPYVLTLHLLTAVLAPFAVLLKEPVQSELSVLCPNPKSEIPPVRLLHLFLVLISL